MSFVKGRKVDCVQLHFHLRCWGHRFGDFSVPKREFDTCVYNDVVMTDECPSING